MSRRGMVIGCAAALAVLVLGATAACSARPISSGAISVGAINAGSVSSGSGSPGSSSTASTATAAASAAPQPSSTAAPTATPAAPPRTVTIGDSIMAGLGLDSADAWPSLLASDTGMPVDNLGCSGAGFIAVGSCDSDYSGLIDQAVQQHPDLIIIESSDNDLGESAAAIDQATTATVDALHAASPTSLIVGLSTLWDQPGSTPEEVADSSDALQNAVASVGGVYLNIGQPLRGNASLLQADDEHPTAAGQQVLVQTVQAALESAGIRL